MERLFPWIFGSIGSAGSSGEPLMKLDSDERVVTTQK